MRRIMIVALSAALLTTTAWVVHGAAANTSSPTNEPAQERGVRIAALPARATPDSRWIRHQRP
jgi:hypothetical protein